VPIIITSCQSRISRRVSPMYVWVCRRIAQQHNTYNGV